MRQLITSVLAAAAAFVVLITAAPAHADLCNEIAKFAPDDGAADDKFGRSVGISGDTAIIGTYFNDGNRNHPGSAYLFDITTGEQLFKLLPDDGAARTPARHTSSILSALVFARGISMTMGAC